MTHPSPMQTITSVQIPGLKVFKQGKIRTVYDFDDKLLIVASDRISAFDSILNEGIPNKARVLTQMSKFWFNKLKMPHHLISTRVEDYPEELKKHHEILDGRSMLVQKTKLIQIECVVRGYMAGSGWKDYQKTGEICGHKLPKGLNLSSKLPTPIFTPAYKATSGHDENISIDKMKDLIGSELSDILMRRSLSIYEEARDYALTKGIIIADTKFEFGMLDSGVLLIDEVLTPDSSRFWPVNQVVEGQSPPSFDKQIVRDYLESVGWDKNPPAPSLPEDIIQKTSRTYQDILELLTSH